MQHSRRIIERLSIDDRAISLTYGALLLVERADGPNEWEAIVTTAHPEPIDLGGYRLSLRLIDENSLGLEDGTIDREDREFEGILVRRQDSTLVFRGLLG